MSSPNNNNNNNNNANQLPGGEDIEKSPPPPKTLDECLEEVMATNAVTRLKRKHKSAESGYVRHTAARLLPHIDFQRNLKLQQKYLGYSDSTVPSTPLAAATAAVAAIVESSEDQRPQPDTLHMCQAGYVRHTAARLLPLLDFEKILQMSQKLRHALDEPTSTVQLASVPQTSQEEEEEEENGDKNDHTANHSDEQPRMVTRSRSSLVVFAMSMTHSSSQMSLMSLFATDATSAELVVSDAAAAAAAADIDPDHQSDTNATQVNADESSPTPRQVPSRPFNFDQYLSELNLVKMHRVLSAESIAPTTHKHDANRGAPEASFVTTRRLETDQSGLQNLSEVATNVTAAASERPFSWSNSGYFLFVVLALVFVLGFLIGSLHTPAQEQYCSSRLPFHVKLNAPSHHSAESNQSHAQMLVEITIDMLVNMKASPR